MSKLRFKGSPPDIADGEASELRGTAKGELLVNLSGGGAATFPAAAALGDSDANPTTTRIGADLQGWDTAQWVRVRVGQLGPTGSTQGVLNDIPFLQFKVTDAAATDNQLIQFQGDNAGRIKTNPVGSSLVQTGTGASGAGVTITLPGVASMFHYITFITLQRFAVAALTAAAAPVVITTTNLPGSLAFSIDASAAAQGTIFETDVSLPGAGLKSSAVNTATTIVAPATTNVIWRVTAYYYAAT